MPVHLQAMETSHAQSAVDLEAGLADGVQEEPLMGATTPEVDLESERRAALKAKGNADLDRALAASSKGQDPFELSAVASSTTQAPGTKRPRRGPRAIKEDPEFKAFGELFENSRSYLYSAIFVVCTAACPVLIKGSLYSMQTPAVLLFLHMLAGLLMLWLASSYDVFQLHQLTLQGLRGSAVTGTLWALQMLCIFSTLHHNSVIFVLCWSLLGREVINSAVVAWANRKPLEGDLKLVLMFGAGAAGVEMLLDSDKVWVGFLMMVLWTGLVAAEAGWRHLKADPSVGGRITNFRVLGVLRDMSDDEDALTPPNRVFLQHAVPAVPILLLGFMALEGRELVNHELSVPAVTVMLLACASHTAAVGCDLLLEGKLEPNIKVSLRAVATMGSILLYFLEEIRTISWAAVVCCTVACLCAYAAAYIRKP